MTLLLRPSVSVTVSAAPPGRDNRFAASRAHFAGVTYRGDIAPRIVRGMSEFERWFGPRQSYSVLYDAASVFFAEGGGELVVSPVWGPSAVSSSVDVDDQQTPTPETAVTVTAVSAGVWGDDVDVAFANGAGTGTTTMTVTYDGTIVEVYADKLPADLVTASEASGYVRVTLGDSTATGNSARPAAATVSLAGGDDDRGDITDDEWEDALAAIDEGYGAGQVAAPGETGGTRLQQVADHAQEFNRVALCDVSSTVATAASTAATLRSAAQDASYAGLFTVGLSARLAGVVRSVPSSAVAAGLMSRNDRSASVNTPAAGVNGVCVSVVNAPVYTTAERNTLTEAGVNAFKTLSGSTRLYGYRSADNDLTAWALLSNVRLRMDLIRQAFDIGERYVFALLDGGMKTVRAWQGDLTGMLLPYWDSGDLYGETPADAAVVDISGNNDETAAAGELLATLGLKFSGFAEAVSIEIVKFAPNQALPAA